MGFHTERFSYIVLKKGARDLKGEQDVGKIYVEGRGGGILMNEAGIKKE